MKISGLLPLAICMAIPLAVGGLAGAGTAGQTVDWYSSLNKPVFSPPSWVFGPVWTLLYSLMGLSLFMVWKSPEGADRIMALRLFAIQIVLNFIWSFIFFKYKEMGWALVEIIALWLSILLMILVFHKINKTASLLQIPYLLWVSFASVLNGSLWWLNH